MSSGVPGLVRSPAKTAVSPLISLPASSATSPSRSLISTFAPSLQKSSAAARPMPRAEPVMIALFPSSSPKFVASSAMRGCSSGSNPFHEAGDSYGFPGPAASSLPEPVGRDPMCDQRALRIPDADLAEAESAAAPRDPRLRAQIHSLSGRDEVHRERDRGARGRLRDLI